MYERFSDRARKVMQTADQTAKRYHHEKVDLFHILMGIVKERGGGAAKLLEAMSASPAAIEAILEELEHLIPKTEEEQIGKISLTPAAKTLIDFAIEEATDDGKMDSMIYIGTEHILLALLRPQHRGQSKSKRHVPHFDFAQKVLQDAGLRYNTLSEQLKLILPNQQEVELLAPVVEAMQGKPQAQGIMDLFRLFDKETVKKIDEIVRAIDVEKVKKVFDAVEVDEDGWVKIHLGFIPRIKK